MGFTLPLIDTDNNDPLEKFHHKRMEISNNYLMRRLHTNHPGPLKSHPLTPSWDLKGLEGVPADGVLDLGKEMGSGQELSIFVRVSRNITAFALPGLMDKQDRVMFEKVSGGPVVQWRCEGQ